MNIDYAKYKAPVVLQMGLGALVREEKRRKSLLSLFPLPKSLKINLCLTCKQNLGSVELKGNGEETRGGFSCRENPSQTGVKMYIFIPHLKNVPT